MPELTFECVLCDGVVGLGAQEMVDHFEAIHPVQAAMALQSIIDEDQQRATAWLN